MSDDSVTIPASVWEMIRSQREDYERALWKIMNESYREVEASHARRVEKIARDVLPTGD